MNEFDDFDDEIEQHNRNLIAEKAAELVVAKHMTRQDSIDHVVRVLDDEDNARSEAGERDMCEDAFEAYLTVKPIEVGPLTEQQKRQVFVVKKELLDLIP